MHVAAFIRFRKKPYKMELIASDKKLKKGDQSFRKTFYIGGGCCYGMLWVKLCEKSCVTILKRKNQLLIFKSGKNWFLPIFSY